MVIGERQCRCHIFFGVGWQREDHVFLQEEAELLISTAEASVPGRLKQRRAAGTARRTAARSAARLQRAARQAEEALQRVERGRKRKKI